MTLNQFNKYFQLFLHFQFKLNIFGIEEQKFQIALQKIIKQLYSQFTAFANIRQRGKSNKSIKSADCQNLQSIKMNMTDSKRYRAYPQHSSTLTMVNSNQFHTFYPNIDIKNVDLMFHQIKTLTKQFLDQIAGVYKYHRIIYPIFQYTQTLLRLICPVQLQTLINVNYASCFFEDQRIYNTQISQNQRKNYTIQSNMNMKDYLHKKQLVISPKVQTNYIGYQSLSNAIRSDQAQKKGRHTVRSRGLEDQIKLWIINELQNNRVVTKHSIMAKSRQMGRSYHFKACPRWCDNFLNRNPDIKTLVYKRLYEDSEKKIKSSFMTNINSFDRDLESKNMEDFKQKKNKEQKQQNHRENINNINYKIKINMKQGQYEKNQQKIIYTTQQKQFSDDLLEPYQNDKSFESKDVKQQYEENEYNLYDQQQL